MIIAFDAIHNTSTYINESDMNGQERNNEKENFEWKSLLAKQLKGIGCETH